MQIKDRSGETFCMAFAMIYLTSIRKWDNTCEKREKTQHKKGGRSNCLDLLDVIISLIVCASDEKKWEHHLFAQLANIINDILFNFILTQKQLNYNNRQKININHNHSPHKQKVAKNISSLPSWISLDVLLWFVKTLILIQYSCYLYVSSCFRKYSHL